MPSYVICPDKGVDFYVYWSTITDSPTAWGTRAELAEVPWVIEHSGAELAARFERAAEAGSSARWPSVESPAYGWDDRGMIYEQLGFLPREFLAEVCNRLADDGAADVTDLLEPFDDDR